MHLPGIRMLPPISVPRPNVDAQDAISAASPPLDPPTVRRTSYGLLVIPIRLFLVSCHLLTSGILVVAKIIAPAFFAKATHSASSFETVFLRASNPNVCNFPLTQVLSFVVKGTPRKGFDANSSEIISI